MSEQFDTQEEGFSQWAIVELMGHKKVAGKVTKDITFGSPILRIDVPPTEAYPAFTQYYGVSAIYCMTPVSVEVACLVAGNLKVDPVSVYAPELVTKEKFDNMVQEYRDHIQKLKNPSLPAGSSVTAIPNNAPIERREYPDDEDDFEPEDEDD